jgi:hypothetical protein
MGKTLTELLQMWGGKYYDDRPPVSGADGFSKLE